MKNEITEKMNMLKSLYKSISEGKHEACQKCPRRPSQKSERLSLPCFDHNWGHHSDPDKPIILQIARDPAARSQTKLLCMVCNQDESGKMVNKLFNSLDIAADQEEARAQYFPTNCVMHACSASSNTKPDSVTLKYCSKILEEQINIIEPEIIICLGNEALQSLWYINADPFKEIGIENKSEIKISKICLSVFQWRGRNVIPMLHPQPTYFGINVINLCDQRLLPIDNESVEKTMKRHWELAGVSIKNVLSDLKS